MAETSRMLGQSTEFAIIKPNAAEKIFMKTALSIEINFVKQNVSHLDK